MYDYIDLRSHDIASTPLANNNPGLAWRQARRTWPRYSSDAVCGRRASATPDSAVAHWSSVGARGAMVCSVVRATRGWFPNLAGTDPGNAMRLAPCALRLPHLPACLPGNVAVASHVQVMTVVVLVAHGLITLNCTTRGSQQPRVVQFSSSTPCATLPITRNLHDVVCLTGPGRPRSYVDGVLVQSYVYGGSYPLPAKGVGRVGIGCVGAASAVAEGVKAWAMSLSS